jgi:hypothetical protein
MYKLSSSSNILLVFFCICSRAFGLFSGNAVTINI